MALKIISVMMLLLGLVLVLIFALGVPGLTLTLLGAAGLFSRLPSKKRQDVLMLIIGILLAVAAVGFVVNRF